MTSALPAAQALDLTVRRIVVTQALEADHLPLIAGRATLVRVTVGVRDSRGSVPGVDGLLHIIVDGAEAPGSPVFSINGPMVARRTADESNLDQTLNFWWVAPEAPAAGTAGPAAARRVDLRVEVNPPGADRVVESDYRNNMEWERDLTFVSRRGLQIAYVPIDYRPHGGSSHVPPAAAIEPAVGDAFARSIFPTGELDYHRAPIPPVVWTQDIDGSNTLLLNTLADIRAHTLSASGAAPLDFIYGWLPGNPFDSNGQALPSGGAAFGNTELRRHQRTFAHEIGHLFGLSHNRMTIDVLGVDVEANGRQPMNLPQIKPPTLRDIMVAGQVSESAWVNPRTYEYIYRNPIARDGFSPRSHGPVLRVAGVFYPEDNRLTLSPTMQFPQGSVSAPAPDGRLRVTAWSGGVKRTKLYQLDVDGPLQADCGDAEPTRRGGSEERAYDDPEAFWAQLPAFGPDGRTPVDQLVITLAASGTELARIQRSRHAPAAEFKGLTDGAALRGIAHVEWTGSDADGDRLVYTLQYSPDAGASWAPLAVNLSQTSFDFDTRDVAASPPGAGRLRLLVSDGFNTALVNSPPLEVGADQPPELFIISPDRDDTYRQAAQVVLHAYAWDREDGLIAASQIHWRSDRDGPLGTGTLWSNDSLSVGAHVLTVTASDRHHQTCSRQVTIRVMARPLPFAAGRSERGTPRVPSRSTADAATPASATITTPATR